MNWAFGGHILGSRIRIELGVGAGPRCELLLEVLRVSAGQIPGSAEGHQPVLPLLHSIARLDETVRGSPQPPGRHLFCRRVSVVLMSSGHAHRLGFLFPLGFFFAVFGRREAGRTLSTVSSPLSFPAHSSMASINDLATISIATCCCTEATQSSLATAISMPPTSASVNFFLPVANRLRTAGETSSRVVRTTSSSSPGNERSSTWFLAPFCSASRKTAAALPGLNNQGYLPCNSGTTSRTSSGPRPSPGCVAT